MKGNTCSLELLGVRDSKRLLEANLHIPRTNETEALVEKPVDWSPPQDLAVACLKSAHTSESADVFKAAGVSLPGCSYCLQPSYTDAARSAKY